MFKEKILAQLVIKYPGVSKKFLGLWADKLQSKVTEETQIEGVINELDNLPVSITDLATEFQKEGDARVTDAEKKWKVKTPPKTEKGKTEDEPETTPGEEPPAWAKSMMTELQELKKEKQHSTIKSKLESHEKLKTIPKSYYSEWTLPENETDLEAFADKVVSKYGEFKQDANNAALLGTTPPGGGIAPVNGAQVIDPAVKAFAEKEKNAKAQVAK